MKRIFLVFFSIVFLIVALFLVLGPPAIALDSKLPGVSPASESVPFLSSGGKMQIVKLTITEAACVRSDSGYRGTVKTNCDTSFPGIATESIVGPFGGLEALKMPSFATGDGNGRFA